MKATKKGADITGAENGTRSSDVLFELLGLLYYGTPSTMIILRAPSGASGNQQCISMKAATNSMLAQPSNIREAVNPGVRATGAVDPPTSTTGPVKGSQLVAPTGSRGSATIVDLDLTIPQESGGQMDIEMTGPTSGVGHDQVLQGLEGGVHRVPAISLVGNGVDGEDQTAAGESAGGKGPPLAYTEMEVDMLDRNKGLKISPAWKGPIQYSMVTPRISRHIPIN
jgi:hypothetical protein